jgi:hypothetical protein
MDMMLWNVILTFASGLFLWLIKAQWDEVKRVQILLNKTREEMAKEYVTKQEVHADINRVLDRLDRLEQKLDRFMEGYKAD